MTRTRTFSWTDVACVAIVIAGYSWIVADVLAVLL